MTSNIVHLYNKHFKPFILKHLKYVTLYVDFVIYISNAVDPVMEGCRQVFDLGIYWKRHADNGLTHSSFCIHYK